MIVLMKPLQPIISSSVEPFAALTEGEVLKQSDMEARNFEESGNAVASETVVSEVNVKPETKGSVAEVPTSHQQGRLFTYSDTHRHHLALGPNHLQLSVNCSFAVRNHQRYGFMNTSQGGAPNYFINSFSGPVCDKVTQHLEPAFTVSGEAYR
uniref:Catalase-like n=1 Tax=Diabrotica virgifera virgifera TaxID=50390 RepID=A0A6P7GUX0_DIAVI